jgi:hypothetical protein
MITPIKPQDPDLAYCEAGDHWTLAHGKGGDDWHSDDSGDYCAYCWEFIQTWRAATWGDEPSDAQVRANARALEWSVTCQGCGVVVDEGSDDEPTPWHPEFHGGWPEDDDTPAPDTLLCPGCQDDAPSCRCRECDPPTPEWK